MKHSTRANTAISRFFLALIVGAVMVWVVTRLTTPLIEKSNATSSDSVAATTRGWFDIVIGNLPLLFLFVALFTILALAVFEREVLR